MIRAALVCSLVVLALQAEAKCLKCPSFQGKSPFDETKFSGIWYPIGGVFPAKPGFAEVGEKKCGQFNVTFTRGTDDVSMKLIAKGMKSGKEKNMEIFAKAFKSEYPSTFYGALKNIDEDKWEQGVCKMSIAATDYEKYAIFTSCKMQFNEKEMKFDRYLYATIMGRDKMISEETFKVLKNLISSYEVDMDKFEMINHTDC